MIIKASSGICCFFVIAKWQIKIKFNVWVFFFNLLWWRKYAGSCEMQSGMECSLYTWEFRSRWFSFALTLANFLEAWYFKTSESKIFSCQWFWLEYTVSPGWPTSRSDRRQEIFSYFHRFLGQETIHQCLC